MKPYSIKRANKDEKKVLLVIQSNGTELTIAQLGKQAFKDKPNKVVAQSHVRNALRRPIKAGLVKQKGRGLYTGTKLIEKWLAGQPVKPAPAKVSAVSKKVVRKVSPKTRRELDKIDKEIELDQMAEKMGTPVRKDAAPAKPESNPLDMPSPEQLKKECEEVVEEFAKLVDENKTGHVMDVFLKRAGLIILVAGHAGKSDSKISRLTGLSRGYLIPRLKGLPEVIPPANHWRAGKNIDEFWALAVRFLDGAKAKIIAEPAAPIRSIPPPF